MAVAFDTSDRAIYTREHHDFRDRVRRFLTEEVLVEYPDWIDRGQPSRRFWERAGEIGLLGIGIPEEYGGLPNSDFRHSAVVTEEIQRLGLAIGGLRVQTDICVPYLLHHGSEAQRRHWLPRLASGQVVVALALSEPGAGSDVKSMRTRAMRDGDHYVVNGSKTFISNGSIAGLVILAAKTDPAAGRNGVTLMLVEPSTAGFETGRKLDKLGLRAQDLAELSFTDMRVPVANVLGEVNAGFDYLTSNLAAERLSIAVNSQAAAASALAWTVEALAGTRPSQDVKFTLADCAVQVAAGQAFIDQAMGKLVAGALTGADAAGAKLYSTELQGRIVRKCLGLHSAGTAYRASSRIGQAHLDGRVSRIYGGSSEIMKVIVSQHLGL
ncbi:acyl-CoA dehydrogenase family protein [Rhodococcus sp. T7]|uniref:acyl-CoA dehydrogenase family protein n=1 Tax=Rhodococcus sp. T7 TaxID=627444 RepID=UPI00135CAE4B|nr:acyl-CoA dehydrogenase family protein [Rhodococcus sp. T7]KAF0956996.1 Acyl-CoA dehydrogenase [Rhodococcus sp. T7]KAF0958701.1 Acyl-CoA dehydrogenase [Rhodococcus sp. T7]